MKLKLTLLLFVLALTHLNVYALKNDDENTRLKYSEIFGFISIVIPVMERLDIKCKTNYFDADIKNDFDLLLKNKTGINFKNWLNRFADINETEIKIKGSIASILENIGGCNEQAVKTMNAQIKRKLLSEREKMALFKNIRIH